MAYEPNNDIQSDFLEGIEEVYSTLLCNHLFLSFLDEEGTEIDDLYGETTHKYYGEPVELIAKVQYTDEKGEEPESTVKRTASIRLPVYQLIKKGIPFLSVEDREKIRQAKLIYEGAEYEIDTVEPSTLVADIWQFLEIRATMKKEAYFDEIE